MNLEKERQGDYVFTANEVGEYSFCFSNDMSTFAEKVVDFEISVENNVITLSLAPERVRASRPPAIWYLRGGDTHALAELSGEWP